MRLNGETKTLKDPVALSDFLTQEGFSDKRIAVERNGEIVPKGEYANVILSDSDTSEIEPLSVAADLKITGTKR